MEEKHISKIVHLHTCNIADIFIGNEHTLGLANENSVISFSLKRGDV